MEVYGIMELHVHVHVHESSGCKTACYVGSEEVVAVSEVSYVHFFFFRVLILMKLTNQII